jgi:hypothetical protein
MATRYDYRSGAQKADSADDLSSQPRRIALGQLCKEELVGQHGQRGAKAHQDMGAKPCGAVPSAPLKTDNPSAEHCERQPDKNRKGICLVQGVN